MKITVL
jgi:hypothetical protein